MIILQFNKNKKTYLTKKSVWALQIIVRLMQHDTSVRTSNAIIEYLTNKNDVLLKEANEISNYILEGLQNEILLSEIVGKSAHNLGYNIQAESFVSFLEAIRAKLRRQGEGLLSDFDYGLSKVDNLKIYMKHNGDLILNPHYRDTYKSFLDTRSIQQPITETTSNVSNTNTNSNTNTDISSNGSNIEYYTLPSDTNTDTSSNGSEHNNIDISSNSNNVTIVMYTIAVFVAIQCVAWYVRTYHKDTLTIEETFETKPKEQVLYSVYENSLSYYNVIISFLIAIIPLYILLIYNYRYYYFSKIIIIFSNITCYRKEYIKNGSKKH